MFSLDLLLNAIVAGILLGGFYAAVSLGISVSFGLLDIVNIAHPAFVILGSYTAYAMNRFFGVDPLGHYIPPFAYAYVQVLGLAVEATKSLDQRKVAEYIQTHEFETIVGKVKFAPNGEWSKSRVLMVQFQNVQGNDIAQFKKPGTRVLLYPEDWKSGTLIYPYSKAQK